MIGIVASDNVPPEMLNTSGIDGRVRDRVVEDAVERLMIQMFVCLEDVKMDVNASPPDNASLEQKKQMAHMTGSLLVGFTP